MYFKQFYLACLAHASYLIGSEGEAVVVDPQRDVDQYISEAKGHDLKIQWVIETHLHADFVSGHRELAARTGAQIVFSRNAKVEFDHHGVAEGDEIKIGEVNLRIMETPGHTPESICILVTDTAHPHVPQKILTGDTLFIGDVGRPDLAGGKGFTPQMMAGMMYDSLHDKLLNLPDEVEVYPAHGAGSMCGKNLSKETSSTIGAQRRFNYALQPMSKDSFVRMMTSDLAEAPAYFPKDAEINRSGAHALTELSRPVAMTPAEVRTLSSDTQTASLRYELLDVRSAAEFGAGHLPGSINIGLGGQFAMWAGSLIPIGTPVVIVAGDETQVDEAVVRLARVGIESVKGFLEGGISAWTRSGFEVATVSQINVDDLHDLIERQSEMQIVDVRRATEYAAGHVPGALAAPLSNLQHTIGGLPLDRSKLTAVICAGGYRSSAAGSILQRCGFTNLLNVAGGTSGWINAGYPVETPEVDLAND